MIITAKFASVCPCCSARIDVGSKVEWAKGQKARHVTCAGPGVASTVRCAPRERSYWRDGARSGAGSAAPVRGYSSYCTGGSSCRCYDCAYSSYCTGGSSCRCYDCAS